MIQLRVKLIGFIIIILGALPFLLKIDSIGAFFAKYKFLSFPDSAKLEKIPEEPSATNPSNSSLELSLK